MVREMTDNKHVIEAHDILIDCGFCMCSFSDAGGIIKAEYEKGGTTVRVLATNSYALFRVNDGKPKEFTKDNLVRSILF